MHVFKRFALPLIFCVICSTDTIHASYFGRFDLGTFSVLPDDSDVDSRVSSTGRILFGWQSTKHDEWSILTDLRLRAEPSVEGTPHYMIWDLRVDYGLDKKPVAGSVGLCRLNEVSGIGSVLGGHLQFNLLDEWSFGLFGGGNPISTEGHFDIDGVRSGAYARYESESHFRAGIALTSISGTDQTLDERNVVSFDTQWATMDSFYFYHFGEITLAKDDESTRLSYYNANVRLNLTESIRVSTSYNHFEYLPYIQFKDEIDFYDQDTTPHYDRNADYTSDSVSPRIDLRINPLWRIYARYRYNRTDYFSGFDSQQWLGGTSCSNLFHSGIAMSASIGSTDRQDRNIVNSFFSLSRDFNRNLNLTLSYSTDRYNRPESMFVSRHAESTHRVSTSIWYRFNESINVLIDYERAFAESDQGDHQMVFNIQYRIR